MAVKNTLADLHNILMETVERLNDDELTGEQLDQELKRAKGITEVGKVICDNANNIIQAQKMSNEAGQYYKTPRILIGNTEN